MYVVLTMRSDFLGNCSQFLDLPECSPDDFIYSYVDSRGNYWVSFAGMVIHFDMHLPVQKPVQFHTMISRVIVGSWAGGIAS